MSLRPFNTKASISLSWASIPRPSVASSSSLISSRRRSRFSSSARSAGEWRPVAITPARLLISLFMRSRSSLGCKGQTIHHSQTQFSPNRVAAVQTATLLRSRSGDGASLGSSTLIAAGGVEHGVLSAGRAPCACDSRPRPPRYRSLCSMTEMADGSHDGCLWPRYGAGDVTPSALNRFAIVLIKSPAA